MKYLVGVSVLSLTYFAWTMGSNPDHHWDAMDVNNVLLMTILIYMPSGKS